MILVIAEKPNVAERIAGALGRARRKKKGKISYFQLDGVTIASAVGHLYGVKQATPSPDYPVFELKWAPAYTIGKESAHTKGYIELLNSLSKNADIIVSATDYDIEGSVIGYTAIKYACNTDTSKARRMKFSTLTNAELKNAFGNLMELEVDMIDAGLTRHELDWLWGMNTSKALTASVKKSTGWFKLLSAGRVQTPTLEFLVKREGEIESFLPRPFWLLSFTFTKDGVTVEAGLKEKIFEKEKAKSIYDDCLGKEAAVRDIEKDEYLRPPPVPFDLGVLQSEAYRCFGYVPKRTQAIAQSLYENGYVSYPRTSSQKLPESLGFKNIIENLGANSNYARLAKELLGRPLKPRQGKKEDPAHPAIYPTGELPGKLSDEEKKLYDLIVCRFLSVFAPPSKHESNKVTFLLGANNFYASGRRTLERGWMDYYRYSESEDIPLPSLSVGEEIPVALNMQEKQTPPPPRFNPSSVIKQMEKLGIGTKATRASILDILYGRKYIEDLPGKQISVTTLGKKIIEALEVHCPRIASVKLTRFFEHEMELIQKRQKKKEEVLEEAKVELARIFTEFKAEEEAIGKTIVDALTEKKRVGTCPSCKGELVINYSPKNKSRFIGCSSYPDCRVTYPLPPRGRIAIMEETCDACGAPIIKSKKEYCVNPSCPKLARQEEYSVGRCEKCGGELKLKFSHRFNSHFVGCSSYPKCTNTLSLPKRGSISPAGKTCGECGHPLFFIDKETFCLNPDCPQNRPPSFGECPKCGSDLVLTYSRKFKKSFVGCSNYPKCKNAFSLPSGQKIESTKEKCACGLPLILFDGKKRCLDVKCKSFQ